MTTHEKAIVGGCAWPSTPTKASTVAIPVPLEALILRLLSKQPEARVQSCQELAGILASMRMTS